MSLDSLRVAIVGAGLSGLSAARRLRDSGLSPVVFDKGRGVGGRMSTRRMPDGDAFDHGAQYFTVRDDAFGRQVADWRAAGVVKLWQGKVASIEKDETRFSKLLRERFVGVPGMNAICRHLAATLDVKTGVRVSSVRRQGDRWRLTGGDGSLGDFDRIVVSAPPAQTAELLAATCPAIAADASAVEMRACWTVMLGLAERLPVEFDGAFVNVGPLSWVGRNNSKPGRPSRECWILHGSPDWSDEHVEAEPDWVVRQLTAAFFDAAQVPRSAARSATAHRWRYSQPREALSARFLEDANLGAYACGDWCAGPRVEGAYLSGIAAAEAVLGVD